MVSTRRAAAERARAAAVAWSKLSGDEQGVILGQLRNALEPRLVMYFSSANKELRALAAEVGAEEEATAVKESLKEVLARMGCGEDEAGRLLGGDVLASLDS